MATPGLDAANPLDEVRNDATDLTMRAVVQRWSGPGFLVRLAITVLTGVTWAVRSLQAVLFDPDYWDPVTSADYFAVYSYSAAFLLTAASLVILRGAARRAPWLSAAVLVVAGACVVTGIANGVEDALGLRGFGLLYVVGILVSGLGLFVIAAMFRTAHARGLVFVPALGGLAMVLMTIGGGVLGLPAWLGFGAILVRERWSPRTTPLEA